MLPLLHLNFRVRWALGFTYSILNIYQNLNFFSIGIRAKSWNKKKCTWLSIWRRMVCSFGLPDDLSALVWQLAQPRGLSACPQLRYTSPPALWPLGPQANSSFPQQCWEPNLKEQDIFSKKMFWFRLRILPKTQVTSNKMARKKIHHFLAPFPYPFLLCDQFRSNF